MDLQRKPPILVPLPNTSVVLAAEPTAPKRQIVVSGPVAPLLKTKRASELPKKVLNLFNPFATEQASGSSERTEPVSARAWSTIAGWEPGVSAFPDDNARHEAQLRLLTFSIEKKPSRSE